MRDKDEGIFWNIFSYLIAGVGFWGIGGSLIDRFLGTSFFVIIGILAGVFLSIYLIWIRYVKSDPGNSGK